MAAESSPPPPPPPITYTRKVLIAVGISLTGLLLLAFIYFVAHLLVLCFAGILLSIFISAPANILSRHGRISRGSALGLVVLSLFTLALGCGYFMGSRVYMQGIMLSRTLPGALRELEADLYKYIPVPHEFPEAATSPAATLESPATLPSTQPLTTTAPANWIAEKIIEARDATQEFLLSASFVRGAGGFVTSTFGIIGDIVVVFGVGIFFAITPDTYRTGALLLIPLNRRERVRFILSQIGGQLQWWFVGQLCSMITIGLLSLIALSILGVPMAITLAILAGLLNFVPYVGPLVAAIPAVLIAFAPRGDSTALHPALAAWTAGAYFLMQMLDGWIFTPFYQKRAVNIPPALIVLAQLTFSLLLGPIGLILATPILASVLVLIRTLYIEDLLGDSSLAPPAHNPPHSP